MLTEKQRWLLAGVGGWMVADCLTDPDAGIPRLMASSFGSSNGRLTDDYPEWLESGVSCGRGRIVSPWFWRDESSSDHPHAMIRKAELRRYALSLTTETRDQLREAHRANTREAVYWSTSCQCPRGIEWHAAQTSPLYRDMWHPTEQQVTDHYARARQVQDNLQQLVLEACGFQPVSVGQLSLF
ncbi:hypothetical protein HH308_06405 [Gordonia sp. TBRC 11910]|uniref:Uncharacterized protein n=1 Tax=Gordonia asplenii TaxID=2725283 RepID=A0A848KP76_9ACTN|nr:hypothetical protein [Gordonia asplenii]NMO00844.1 hypothetical protein [Gordonia asplenii]